jgi:hypothetical protein
MKRFGNLYEKIYSIENIRLAHQNARKGKKFYKEVKMVDDRGVDFIGYRFFHAFTLLRKSIATNFKNKIKKVRVGFRSMGKLKVVNGIMSYYGWIKYGDCRRLFRKYVGEDVQNIMELFCVLLKQKNPLKEALL